MFKVFRGSNYYPEGGYEDFIGSVETMDEALFLLATHEDSSDWWHIVHEDKIIRSWKKPRS